MAKKKMDETELSGLITTRIADCRQFDSSDLALNREWAIRFYDGEVDIPSETGRSAVVSQDVADVIEWILPGLLRVFTASERTAIYEPVTPEDEQMAKQATDGINYIFLNECDGYAVMKDSMHNGLLHGNGPIKVWWEGAPEYKTETVRGLTEQEYLALISEPDVEEVLEVSEYLVGPDGNPIEEAETVDKPAEEEDDSGPAGISY